MKRYQYLRSVEKMVRGRIRFLHKNLLLLIGTKLTSPVPAPRTKKLRTVRDQKVEAEEPPNQHNTDESDEENDFLYFAGQPPVVGDESDVLDDGRSSDAGTVTGDDQDSVQNLEEGLREDALNQSTDTDDPEVSTHVNNNNVVIPLQIVDDPDNAVRDQEDESDEIPERTPVRRSTRTRTKPNWMNSYICNQIQSSKWRDKALFFSQIADKASKLDKETSSTLLKLLSDD